MSSHSANAKSYRIKAVLFDFDGTLTRPGALDFPAIKAELGCPPDTPVLEFIRSLSDDREQRAALLRLNDFEMAAAADSRPNPGAEALIGWLKRRAVLTGIVTRNSRASVQRALTNFDTVRFEDFDLVISRDDAVAPKPSGDGIALAARRLGIAPEQVLMVGDFVFDAAAGRAAGALTALLDPRHDPALENADCDFRIRHLDELTAIVRDGLPLAAGKLPNDLLQGFLEEFRVADPSVLIEPGVGEDIAAVDAGGADVLVLKSDPITFATDAIGHYAVLVNANDIATAGADPRWFLTTLLLPCGIVPSEVRGIMGELAAMCARWNIALCGGHTEITDAVRRPLVIGMMAGTVARNRLVEKKGMREGDIVLMTKAAAVEGTAVIAREFGDRLLKLGFSRKDIELGRRFLDRIGVVEEARLAARDHLASAMHDVTEGGVATALSELSVAGGHTLRVEIDHIPVYDLTRRICAALGLNPLGLIGSGSLLICCRPDKGERLVGGLTSAGMDVTRIGTVGPRGAGVAAFDRGEPVDWPVFEADEIARLFRS
jgi:hydrogenase expression/formation protein HypE